MKKITLIAFVALLPLLVVGQGWPAGYGGVMLQGFFWDSYLEHPDFGPNGTQQQRDLGNINIVPHSNPWGANIRHTWATMYDAGWGAGTDDWEVPLTSWANLEAVKGFVAPFIDLLWLPQSGATIAPALIPFSGSSTQTRGMRGGAQWNFNPGDYISNPDANGFVPYLWFDHGRGESYTYYTNGNPVQYTSMTYFGTEAELKSCIAAYKAMGCGAIEDVVINHKGFAGDFWFQENYTDPSTGHATSTNWTKADLVGLVYRNGGWTNWYMPLDGSTSEKQITGGGTGRDDGNYGGWANEVAHTSENAQRNTINYLRYLKDELGYAGFRYDYAAGLAPGRFAQYNMATTPTFSVGEFWTDTHPSVWIKNTASDGNITSAAFDFPLMSTIKNCFNSGYFHDLKDAGMLHDNILKRYAVNFIANHDTNKNLPTDTSNPNYANRTNSNIVEANAFLLAMPGTPCLFWAHFMHPAWHDDICRMILARRAAGVTNDAAIESAGNVGSNGVWWIIKGEKGRLLLQLGSDAVNQGNRSGYTEVFTSAVCRLAISNDAYGNADFANIYNNVKPALINGYPVFDKPSGSYYGTVTVNVRPSSEGCTLVYTTNGQNPTAASQRITAAEGVNLTFTESTDLRVGVLLGGEVVPTSIVHHAYVVSDDYPTTGEVKVYVYDPNGNTPNIYAWNGDDQDTQYTGGWPGWPMNYTKQIGGITWREATIPASKFNMILSEGGNSQTHNINNVDHEVFYTFRDGIATDVTSTYVKALHDPMVSIDRASGAYTGNLMVNLTSSVEGATIVYTIDRWETDIEYDAANQRTSTDANVPVTFATNGSHLVRAAILKNGSYIGKVARTYQVSGASGSGTTSGINIYVKNMVTNDRPRLYAWDNNQNALTNGWPGTQLSTTASNCGQTWYKYSFSNRTNVNLLFAITGDKDKTANISITAPGDYYYYYYPGAHFGDNNYHAGYIDVSNDSRHTTTTKAITVFMWDNGQWANILKLYPYSNGDIYWNWGSSWAEEGFPKTTINGQSWYYATFMNKSSLGAIVFNGNNGSERFEVSNTSSNVFIRFPKANDNWSTGSNVTSTYSRYLPAVETPQAGAVAAATLPSSATWVTDKPFCYFENTTSMAVPSAWVWNASKNLSGVTWPGEQLFDMVGISPEGHAIYRWTCATSDMPTKLIFSDGGANATSELTFENGGYYTVSGKQGVVADNVRSLVDLIADASLPTSKEIVVSNDLEVVYVSSDGSYAYAKDRNGDAIAPSVMQPGQKFYPGTNDYNYLRGGDDFDQSNWVKLLAPTGGTLLTNTMTHQHLAQTMVGRVIDHTNPTIQLAARPITDYTATDNYQMNTYIPASFVDQTEYFFVRPKAGEMCHVVWACYRGMEGGKHVFAVPASEQGSNGYNLDGAFAIEQDADYQGMVNQSGELTFNVGQMYELVGVIKALPASGGNGAPRRVTLNPKQSPVSDDFSLSVMEVITDSPIITVVDDLTGHVERQVQGVIYYNVAGQHSSKPFPGINIAVTRYTDGSTSTAKIVH
ncbi:MAG: starch-binding protein [Muribaculaceae bacterium]|nr:starch-binding protein [Muribaculaceae bacterium]